MQELNLVQQVVSQFFFSSSDAIITFLFTVISMQWNIELEEMEKSFLEQAAQVNVADRELMENGEKVPVL